MHTFDQSPAQKPKKSKSAANAIDFHMGQRIHQRRREIGMTLKTVAKHCGVSLQQIHKYESGESRMGASMLYDIAHILRVPIGYFYDGLSGLYDAPDVARPDDTSLET